LASPTGYGSPKTPKTVAGKVEEKISLLVMGAKREASTIADEVADKLDKVATPVLEAVAPRRGPGRPPKTPADNTPAAKTAAPSSPRLLRSRRTPGL